MLGYALDGVTTGWNITFNFVLYCNTGNICMAVLGKKAFSSLFLTCSAAHQGMWARRLFGTVTGMGKITWNEVLR